MTETVDAGTAPSVENPDSDTRPRGRGIFSGLRRRSDAEIDAAVANGQAAQQEPMAKKRDTPPDFLESFEDGQRVPSATWIVGAPPPDGKNADKVRPVKDLGKLDELDPDLKSVIDSNR